MLAHAVGALVMSRACPDDSPLADEILATCRDAILASLASSATPHAGRNGEPPPPDPGAPRDGFPSGRAGILSAAGKAA
jgi:TetR/AcrR family transcriptional repressor of nem operon